jgi:NADH-quinone oxidoreductase E subunit
MSVFEFNAANKKIIKKYMARYPKGREQSTLIPILDLAQRQLGGWISIEAMEEIASLLNIPPMRVREVATFYSMFNLKPVGQYHIQLCRTTPCWLNGSDAIKEACESTLGIKVGDVSKDGRFSIIEVECLGACVNAPMIQINDDFYEDLTPDNVKKLLRDIDNHPHVGSQTGRHSSEPHTNNRMES